jgi:Domain of unknown function (DUF4386)
MYPTNKDARIAALCYALMGLPAPFALIYIPRMLVVRGDAAATAKNILAHQMLFRVGVFGELFTAVAFILLALALYRLLSGVNKTQASLMVILVAISVAITFANVVNNMAALTLFRGDFLAALDKGQREAWGMLFLGLHHQGLVVNQIFWGLWLLPFGVLVMRSRFLPRILGVLLIVNCCGYVAVSLTSLLLPSDANLVSRAVLPALLGELWIWLWLLIKGVKPQPLAAAAP